MKGLLNLQVSRGRTKQPENFCHLVLYDIMYHPFQVLHMHYFEYASRNFSFM